MSISVTCPSCHKALKAPDKAAGHKVKCPQCNNTILIPIPQKPTPLLDEPPEPQISKLITCEACGQRIATTAKSCPQCGATNVWVHPEIKRFLNSLDQFQHMPSFEFNHDGMSLHGVAEVTRGTKALVQYSVIAGIGGILCFLYGTVGNSELAVLALIVGPLAVITSLVLVLLFVIQKGKSTDYVVNFTIDFQSDPPQWRSDDEEFWKFIKNFFFSDVSDLRVDEVRKVDVPAGISANTSSLWNKDNLTMSISVTCPSCHQALKAPDNAAGHKVKCPGCGTSLTIPAPQTSTAPLEVLTEVSPMPKWRAKIKNRTALFAAVGGGVLVLLVVMVLVLISVSGRSKSSVEVSVNWNTPNGIDADDNPVAVLIPKGMKDKIDEIAPIYAGEKYEKTLGTYFSKCGAYLAVGVGGKAWLENVDRGSYTLLIFPNSFFRTIDAGVSEEEATRAEKQLQQFFTRVRLEYLRRKPVFICDIEVQDQVVDIRHEFHRRGETGEVQQPSKTEEKPKKADVEQPKKTKKPRRTKKSEPSKSNSEDQQRAKLLAELAVKKREALPALQEETRQLEEALKRLREEETILRQNPRFGDPFNKQVMSQFNNLLKKQRALANKVQNSRDNLEQKIADFEQERRKILLKFPMPGDTKLIEHRGLLYTQEELNQQIAYEKDHADPRTVADSYLKSLAAKGIVSRPKLAGFYNNPKGEDSLVVAYTVASVNGRQVLGNTVHVYVFKDKGGYWQLSAFSQDGVHVMLGPPPSEFQRVRDPSEKK